MKSPDNEIVTTSYNTNLNFQCRTTTNTPLPTNTRTPTPTPTHGPTNPEFFSGITKYYYFGSQRVALRQGGDLYYLHSDHLGSTSTVTNESGVCSSQQAYYPYGAIRPITPTSPCGETVPTDFGFTGQRRDASSGLMYYGARYYDAGLGRFVSADTIVPSAGNPQTLNRYSYTYNNPVRYTDPTGHCPFCIIGLLAVGVYVGMLPGDTGPYPPDPAGDFVAELPLRVVSDPADYILTGRDCIQGNCDALDIAFAAAPILTSQMRKAVDFKYTTRATGEADDFIQGVAKIAEDTVTEKNLLGSFDAAKLEADEGKAVLSGIFMYNPTKEYKIDGYQQHHLWSQALGGPKQGWIVYAKDSHIASGGIQDRLNKFLIGHFSMSQRAFESWAQRSPDRILPLLREFYEKEGIPFPY